MRKLVTKLLITGSALLVFAVGGYRVTSAQPDYWRTYSPAGQRFSVKVPTPFLEVMAFDGEHGATLNEDQRAEFVKAYAALVITPGESRFGVVVINQAARTRMHARMGRDELFDALAAVLIGDEDEAQFMRPPVDVPRGGLRSREYLYIKDQTAQSPLFTRGRIYDTGKKIYVQVYIGTDAKDLKSNDAERFFASFRLNKK